MMEMLFEGSKYGTAENDAWLKKLEMGEEIPNNVYIEAKVMSYTSTGDLTVSFGSNFGIIKHENVEFPLKENTKMYRYKGTIVGFYVIGRNSCSESSNCCEYELSRAAVTKEWFNEYVTKLEHGDIISGRICHISRTKLMLVDIGYGFMTALVPINATMINCKDMGDVFAVGEEIKLIVLSGVKETGEDKITVTHKELLGTFEQNASLFTQGQRLWARVYDVQDWGTFIQLTPNTLGLTLNADTSVEKGQAVYVEICGIKPSHNKIQVQILGKGDENQEVHLTKGYFIEGNDFKTMSEWHYSPKRSSNMTRSM